MMRNKFQGIIKPIIILISILFILTSLVPAFQSAPAQVQPVPASSIPFESGDPN